MNRIKIYFSILILTFLVGCSSGEKKIIGISKIVSHPALDAVEKGIVDEIVEQKIKVEFDLQNANGDLNTAGSIAAKFKNEKVAVAIGIATPVAQALVNTLKSTPILFSAVTDPVKAGLVASISPGDPWVTGVSDMTPVKEQISLLVRLKPIKRLGLIYSSHEANAVVLANIAKEVCKELGLEVVEATVTSSSEVKQAAQSIINRIDAIYVSTDNTVVSALAYISELAMKYKIPIFSADPTSAEKMDILAAWGFDYYKMGRITGKMAIEILKGKKVSEMGTRFMTDPSDIDLLINLDVAKKLSITIPEDVLKNANTIIKDGKVLKKAQ